MVGLLGVCELVPLLVMAFVGGALADFLDRRLLVRGGEFALAALCGVLLLNALSDKPHLWLLYVVAALTASVDGLQRPALEAMVPRLVQPAEIPATMALQSLGMQVAQLGGPALAGVLIATVDLDWVYAFDLATFAVSLICLTLVRAVPPPPDADRPSLRSVVDRPAVRAQPPGAAGHVPGGHQRDVLRHAPGAVPVPGHAARRADACWACSTPRRRSARCWPRSAPAGPAGSTGTA